MVYSLESDLADFDWDAVYAVPDILEHLIPESGVLPDWIAELRKHRISGCYPIIKRKPQFRAADCNSWIKKNNRYDGGIRKRNIEINPPKFGMPRPETLAQYQRHSIHLMTRVLSLRTNASPFTLVLDDLNQRATPLIHELGRRGLSRNVNVVVLSFEAATGTLAGTYHIPAWGNLTGDQILQEIETAMSDYKESLVIVDSLYDLLNVKNVDMGVLFNLVAVKYVSTLIGVYHQDVLASQSPEEAYIPQPLEVFKYMATTVITCKSFAHVLAAKAAKERSLPEPTHGLLQGAEGVVQSLNANDHLGIVLEAEFRRKSGRSESETYFLRAARVSDYNDPLPGMVMGTLKKEFVVLLDQVPTYRSDEIMLLVKAGADEVEPTFNLELTEKQKEAREGVVLPYFDAQKGEGGEGGRILYDMGEEDDFDEEEDEV